MPQHDPIPPPLEQTDEQRAAALQRFKAIMSWMAVAAVGAMALTLLYLWLVLEKLTIGWAIATLVGVGVTVLLGTGLMALVYFSDRSGMDESAGGGRHDGER